jgi:chorismate mutase/prephenate dehydratase
MENKTVACYGAAGSYSWEAMKSYFDGTPYTYTLYDSFEETIQSVAEGKEQYGVVPIENSSTGGITAVYDLLWKNPCHVAAEKMIRIDHNLLSLPEASLEDIEVVYSHPQGLAQSQVFLKKHPWDLYPYYSTAKSAEKIKMDGKKNQAAVASAKAAELYGLKILVPHIQTYPYNYTRFFIISGKETEHPEQADKITLVLTVPHEPGALYHVLGHFFYNGMNMTHLESRPLPGRPFEYFFHIDVMGNLQDAGVRRTLEELRKSCADFRILGNYPSDQEVMNNDETGTHW